MKKKDANRPTRRGREISGLRLNAKERKVLQASWRQVNELTDRLGLFDPMDCESPMIFFAEERKR